jgi:four helix bundle protein
MSIPANIVEGTARGSDPDFARFVKISIGSTTELEYHLIQARDCAAITKSDFDSLSDQAVLIRKMLYALLRRLNDPGIPPVASPSSSPVAIS